MRWSKRTSNEIHGTANCFSSPRSSKHYRNTKRVMSLSKKLRNVTFEEKETKEEEALPVDEEKEEEEEEEEQGAPSDLTFVQTERPETCPFKDCHAFGRLVQFHFCSCVFGSPASMSQYACQKMHDWLYCPTHSLISFSPSHPANHISSCLMCEADCKATDDAERSKRKNKASFSLADLKTQQLKK